MRYCTLIFSSFVTLSPALAQTDWTLQTPPVRPPVRAWMGMAYDQVRDRTVVAGGFDNATGLALGDTWEHNGTNWFQVPAANAPARDCMFMTYALTTGRTIMFGGLDTNFNRLGDTWEYDGSNWTQTATTGPSPRVYMALAYDLVRDRVVGFGGGNTSSMDDTWEYDPQTGVWTQATPSTTPPTREGQGMVYDLARQLVVMHGGWDSSAGIRTDTWEYDGSDWTQRVTPAAPTPPRMCFGMVYDNLRNRVILHGGTDMNFTVNYSDTWEFDGSTWAQLTPLTPGPARPGIGMAHDIQAGVNYVFGGEDAPTGVDSDELWELRTVNPPSVGSFGSGCSGSVGTPALDTTSRPWIGESFDLQLINLPAVPAAAIFVLGFSDTIWGAQNLPLPLGSFGLPGCSLLTSADATLFVFHSGSIATMTVSLPNDPGIIGLGLFAQGMSLDNAASNGIGAVSNGVAMVLGSR